MMGFWVSVLTQIGKFWDTVVSGQAAPGADPGGDPGVMTPPPKKKS